MLSHLGNRPLISLTNEECKFLFLNLDTEIAPNENFIVNGLKLFYCDTSEELQALKQMSLPEAKAMMHNITIYKKEGVPVHLLDAKGIMEQFFSFGQIVYATYVLIKIYSHSMVKCLSLLQKHSILVTYTMIYDINAYFILDAYKLFTL